MDEIIYYFDNTNIVDGNVEHLLILSDNNGLDAGEAYMCHFAFVVLDDMGAGYYPERLSVEVYDGRYDDCYPVVFILINGQVTEDDIQWAKLVLDHLDTDNQYPLRGNMTLEETWYQVEHDAPLVI